jgi:ECF sigma factor
LPIATGVILPRSITCLAISNVATDNAGSGILKNPIRERRIIDDGAPGGRHGALIHGDQDRNGAGRGQFLAAAAEAMRRILVDNARYKAALIGGGQRMRHQLDEASGENYEPVTLRHSAAQLRHASAHCRYWSEWWSRNASTQSSHAQAHARQSARATRVPHSSPRMQISQSSAQSRQLITHTSKPGLERCDSQNSLHSRALAAHAAIQESICSWFMVSAPENEGRPCDKLTDFGGFIPYRRCSFNAVRAARSDAEPLIVGRFCERLASSVRENSWASRNEVTARWRPIMGYSGP